jgi:hypothetical protein
MSGKFDSLSDSEIEIGYKAAVEVAKHLAVFGKSEVSAKQDESRIDSLRSSVEQAKENFIAEVLNNMAIDSYSDVNTNQTNSAGRLGRNYPNNYIESEVCGATSIKFGYGAQVKSGVVSALASGDVANISAKEILLVYALFLRALMVLTLHSMSNTIK